MSGLSVPASLPIGKALLVAGPATRARPLEILHGLGFRTAEADDPYAAMVELCRRPLVYRAVVLSLASVYREELAIIPAITSRFAHLEVWLAHTETRHAALAEAMRLGAEGLLAEDGLHRMGRHVAVPTGEPFDAVSSWGEDAAEQRAVSADPSLHPGDGEDASIPLADLMARGVREPVLTPDELRALLHEQSPVPPRETE